MSENSVNANAAPGEFLGLLGGGQLGRMFCAAAQSLGYQVMVVDPASESPAAAVADRHLQGDYLDEEALDQLSLHCVAVTTEFENVPAKALERLAKSCAVSPAASAVAIAQNRMAEKAFAVSCGVPVAPHAAICTTADIHEGLLPLLPGILKTARMGYDGKGQVRIASLAELSEAFAELNSVECVLEKRLQLDLELSVIVARNQQGQCVTFPIAENQHTDGILATSIIPGRVAPSVQDKAADLAVTMASQLNYVGVLCIEFFLLTDGELLVNEMAPRPHNSGHYSIDACVTSQFEQQARILAGLPLGSTRQHSPAVMVNLLGDLWFRDGGDTSIEPDWPAVLAIPEVKLHLYGKKEARAGRKMGHITCVADTLEAAIAAAQQVRLALGIAA
ncbi:MAG: 5-(carboxyamino)imidazole ribonucleotide synthase [Burkholderiales bacterium]|nr:5-(carboxyamino)imidazole ribonucleotide synthase [Burkholderiales bacterium]